MLLNIAESNESSPAATEQLLTNAECEQILRKAWGTESKLQLKDFVLMPAENANGYLGEYYHLLVHYNVVESDENKNVSFGHDSQICGILLGKKDVILFLYVLLVKS